MSATVDEAKAIIGRFASTRVRVSCGAGHCIEGRLRPELRYAKDGIGGPKVIVHGRRSDWRSYAAPFVDDSAVYAKALCSAARPEMIYVPFHFADRIETAAS